MNEKNYLDYFKYNVTKISLFLAIVISFTFLTLRIFNIIPRDSIATVNTTGLFLFLSSMYLCLIRCKDKLSLIQLITYFVIISFIIVQTVLASNNIFLPVWIDFTIMTAYIATTKKNALIISLYALIALIALRLSGYYTINAFSFMTLLMSFIAFSILGLLISIQLDKYNKENIIQSKKLEKLALIDELTDIFNRRAFYKIGQKILMQSKRENKPLSLIMMDIDYFKHINDTYGHKAGDTVLKEFVNEIKSIIRQNDLFSRIGGEEFVILLYDADHKSLEKIANKILNKIRNHTFNISQDKTINITVSLGVYTVQNNEENIQQALINADKALYVAKKTGRNRVVYY